MAAQPDRRRLEGEKGGRQVKVYKFIVGSKFVELPSDPSLSVSNIVAVVLAETEEQARQIIRDDGEDSRWLEVARVTVIDLDRPRLLAFAQV
jgi:hypothetical protein